ncbi:hypothetical protein MKW92_042386 [Papaver armeniacum]|nr:hypothetical protein MKW92_042386 [Papaver armeniacum]
MSPSLSNSGGKNSSDSSPSHWSYSQSSIKSTPTTKLFFDSFSASAYSTGRKKKGKYEHLGKVIRGKVGLVNFIFNHTTGLIS